MSSTSSPQLQPDDIKKFNARRLERELQEAENGELMLKLQSVSDDNLTATVNNFQKLGQHNFALKAILSCGRWSEAIDYVNKHAKNHQKDVYFQLGKKLELQRNYKSAIRAFESAGVHMTQVPRMLLSANRYEDLEAYVRQKNCKELWTWWGHYCESIGAEEDAFESYQTAEDTFSIVKFFCTKGNQEKAEEAARMTSDRASLFYLARQFEAVGNSEKAIEFFALSGEFRHGVRLAKACGKDDFLLEFAQRGKTEDILEAALYFEQKSCWSTALTLYSKVLTQSKMKQTSIDRLQAGNFSKAVDMYVVGREGNLSDLITEFHSRNLTEQDKREVQKFVDALVASGELKTAIAFLCSVHETAQALEIVEHNEIVVDEDLADKLCSGTSDADEMKTHQIRTAKLCKRQGSFVLAAKKFSEAGERIKAVKYLIKSGDIDKIISFANRSRSCEILVMTANYLRTLNWIEDDRLKETIIMFYTKAQAQQQLFLFRETEAQQEIDEFRDYEKGLDALRASKVALHSLLRRDCRTEPLIESDLKNKEQNVAVRLEFIERFLQARSLLQSDSKQAFQLCRQLLCDLPDDHNNNTAALRIGDVYALLIEFAFLKGDKKTCQELLEEMKDQDLPIGLYVENSIIQKCQMKEEDTQVIETINGTQ